MKFQLLILVALIGVTTFMMPSETFAQTTDPANPPVNHTSSSSNTHDASPVQEQAIPATDNTSGGSFLSAIKAGDTEGVKKMKRDSANYYRHYGGGETALTSAILTNNVDMVAELVKKAVINVRNQDGETPLTLAIKRGNKPIIELVMRRAKASLKNKAGEAPLFLALDSGDYHLIQKLIDKGADVDRKSNGVTPLAKATTLNNYKLVGFLIKKGATVNQANDDGETPLYLATKNGYDVIAGILIAHTEDGFGDVNWISPIGETLLNIAAANDHFEIVNMLLQNGAEASATDHLDNTPLHIAAENGNDKIIVLLLEKEADIDARNLKGATPLIAAAEMKRESTIRLLLDKGANPDLRNYQGYAAADFHSSAKTYRSSGALQQTKMDAPNRASDGN